MTVKMSSYNWLLDPLFKGYVILDPDGWDRTRLKESMEELVTFDEFRSRLYRSTIKFGELKQLES